jgi:hypothetical protein
VRISSGRTAGRAAAGAAAAHVQFLPPDLTTRSEFTMQASLSIGPVISLIAGILILIVPRLLNYIVAFYLILIGLVGLLGSGYLHVH